MNTEIINEHFTQGGTGITNFLAKDRPLYEDAIKAFGSPHMVINDKPMPPSASGHSLHYLLAQNGPIELGAFWKVWDEVRKQRATVHEDKGQ